MAERWSELQDRLGVHFKDAELLRQAFIHRSYLNENPRGALSHNERLEFLGDAVLELIVTEHLYRTYPNPEGELTTWRAALVNAQTMGEIGMSLGFNEYLLLSRGEAKDTGRARQVILANTLEAVIGALYLDQGYEAAHDFTFRHIIAHLPTIISERRYRDAKSLFQEAAQEKLGMTPTYQLHEETGPDHDKIFTVGVYVGEERIAEGRGASKQEAEQEAARAGLLKKGWV